MSESEMDSACDRCELPRNRHLGSEELCPLGGTYVARPPPTPVLLAALEVARCEYAKILDDGYCQVCNRDRGCAPNCAMAAYEQACHAAGVSPIDGAPTGATR